MVEAANVLGCVVQRLEVAAANALSFAGWGRTGRRLRGGRGSGGWRQGRGVGRGGIGLTQLATPIFIDSYLHGGGDGGRRPSWMRCARGMGDGGGTT